MSRIFIGIPLSRELQKAALNFYLNHQNLKARWMSGQNLHVTLVPPFEAGNLEIEEIKKKLARVKSAVSFNIKFGQINFGPSLREPRLIWASGEASGQIMDLRLKLYEALSKPEEDRAFKLHATLARFRPEDFKNFPTKIINEEMNWQMEVGEFILYESLGHSNYKILEKFSLI